jgi:1-acyl-sn-glycerol-3-phosphate acyltransferase
MASAFVSSATQVRKPRAGPRTLHNLAMLGRALFVPPWTLLVTASAIALAKLTRDPIWIQRGQRFWARGCLRAWNVRVEIDWPDDVDRTGPYIVMANHASYIDVPLLFMSLPFVPGFVAKQELGKVPVLAMALRAGGHVLLDRADGNSALRALRTAASKIRQGQTLAIFPEGTRGNGQVLSPFKKGGFVLAKSARVAIVPVGIRGSHEVLARGAFLPQAGLVRVTAGRPIVSEEIRSLSADALLARVRAEIAELSGLRAAPSSTPLVRG